MDTNPQAEVAQPSVEDVLAAKFGEKAEQPEVEEPEDEQPEEAEASEPQTEEPEAQAEEDDGEEVDFEGTTYKVPKVLKDALLRQKDYTQKTQEIAERRRQVEEREAYLQQVEQLRSAQFEKAVEIHALERQLKQYEELPWMQLVDQDPTQAQKLSLQFDALRRQHASATQALQQVLSEEQAKSAQARQQMLAKGHENLAREIKGWGPELAKQVMQAGSAYGFSDRELASVVDPRMVKVLHDAKQWRDLQAAKPAVQKKVAESKPIQVKARTAQTNQEAAKVQDLRQQLRKTGSKDIAEELLYQRFARRK